MRLNLSLSPSLTRTCLSTLLYSGLLLSIAIAQPTVDLGPDFGACDSTVLDAGNVGASYVWSTTATSQTITVSTSGLYWVDVTDNNGTSRDSVFVSIVATPVSPNLPDIDVCGPGTYTINGGNNQDLVFWYDSDTAQRFISVGDSIRFPVTDSTTIYAEAANLAPIDTVGISDLSVFNPNFQPGRRGISFDVFSPAVLTSVAVYADQPSHMLISLETSTGTILDSITVFLPNGGGAKNVVPLFFDLPIGTDLRLMGEQVAGTGNGYAFLNVQVPYPFVLPGIMQLTPFNGATNRFMYFFEWVVSQKICKSARVSSSINVLPVPMVDLGPDTAVCESSYLLSVTDPGNSASFLWSTGDTTLSISINQSDTVWVEGTIGSCSIRDTAAFTLISPPPILNIPDLDVCGPGTYTIQGGNNQDLVFWYNSDTTQRFVAVGDNYDAEVTDSTTIYAESVNLAPIDTVGIYDLSQFNPNFQPSRRGMAFDVFTPSVLTSVSIYADQPSHMLITLETNTGTILDSMTVFLPNGGGARNVVPLFFDLPVGNDLRLMGEQVSGSGNGYAFLNVVVPYPFVSPGLIQLIPFNGATNRFMYFFEWIVSQKTCVGPREAIQINVLPAPEIDLGPDTILCESSYLLDASSPGASFAWSTGDTTSSIFVSQQDTIWVEAAIGNCVKRDTVEVDFVPLLMTPIPADTNICSVGLHPYTFEHDGDLLVWYENDTTDEILFIGDTLYYQTQDTTTLYAESLNHSEILPVGRDFSNIALANYQANRRQMGFEVKGFVTLQSVKMYADAPTEASIYLETEQGTVLDSIRIQLPAFEVTEVFLFFDLEPGNYLLVGTNIEGGNLAYFTSGHAYPYQYEDQISINYADNNKTNRYYYFYDWEFARQICRSPRMPVTIEIALPLDLGEDIYSCDDVLLDAGNPAADILWNTGATSQLINVFESGKYWVEISDSQGCQSIDTIEVTIPELNLGMDGIICGTTLITGYDSTSIFAWSTGDSTPNLDLVMPGTYWVTVQEPLGCTLEDTIQVSGFADFPTVDLGSDFSDCDSAMLDAGNPGEMYLWNTGDTTQTIQIYSAGIYTATVTNSFGCSTTDDINVFIAPSPEAEFAYLSNGLTVNFENLSSLGSNFWDFGDGATSTLRSPIHTYSDTGVYTVQLIIVDILNNCGSDTFFLSVHVTQMIDGIDRQAFEGQVKVFPNPIQEFVEIRFLDVSIGDAQIRLTDLAGRQVYSHTTYILSPQHKEVLELPGKILPGVYFLSIDNHSGRFSQIVMVQ